MKKMIQCWLVASVVATAVSISSGSVYAAVKGDCAATLSVEEGKSDFDLWKERVKDWFRNHPWVLAIKGPPTKTPQELREAALRDGANFLDYFKSVNKSVLEREYVVDLLEMALVAREHVLLLGPPGNAKTGFARTALGNLYQKIRGRLKTSFEPSYFQVQMTPETTLSETHGSVDFKMLNKEGRIRRHYDEGILGYRVAFIDEKFDAMPNMRRNLLDVLADRSHSAGGKTHKGSTWTVVGASNKYLSEVYEEAGGKDGPKAVLDRYAFVAFVPREFEFAESYDVVIQNAGRIKSQFPRLTFDQIETLQDLKEQVVIPTHVSRFLTLLSGRLSSDLEVLQEKSIDDYDQKKHAGENALPPYRNTKYFSIRSIGKAAGILQAYVVIDWVKSGGRRPLSVTLEDVAVLEKFFAMNGPGEEFLNEQIARSTSKHEKEQLETSRLERQKFQQHYQTMLKEFSQIIAEFAPVDTVDMVNRYETLSSAEKENLLSHLKNAYIATYRPRLGKTRTAQLDPRLLAYDAMNESVRQWLEKIQGVSAQGLIARWEREYEMLLEKKRQEEEEFQKQQELKQQSKEKAKASGADPHDVEYYKNLFRNGPLKVAADAMDLNIRVNKRQDYPEISRGLHPHGDYYLSKFKSIIEFTSKGVVARQGDDEFEVSAQKNGRKLVYSGHSPYVLSVDGERINIFRRGFGSLVSGEPPRQILTQTDFEYTSNFGLLRATSMAFLSADETTGSFYIWDQGSKALHRYEIINGKSKRQETIGNLKFEPLVQKGLSTMEEFFEVLDNQPFETFALPGETFVITNQNMNRVFLLDTKMSLLKEISPLTYDHDFTPLGADAREKAFYGLAKTPITSSSPSGLTVLRLDLVTGNSTVISVGPVDLSQFGDILGMTMWSKAPIALVGTSLQGLVAIDLETGKLLGTNMEQEVSKVPDAAYPISFADGTIGFFTKSHGTSSAPFVYHLIRLRGLPPE